MDEEDYIEAEIIIDDFVTLIHKVRDTEERPGQEIALNSILEHLSVINKILKAMNESDELNY